MAQHTIIPVPRGFPSAGAFRHARRMTVDANGQTIGVSLIEDDPQVRRELGSLVSGTVGLRLVSTHPTAEDALDRLPFGITQVALVDIQLPRLSGIECAKRLRRQDPGLLVLMLTAHEDPTRLFESLRAGAVGYILKRDPPTEIVRAVFDVVAGDAPMSPSIARKVIQQFHTPPTAPTQTLNGEGRLSPREHEIVELIARGYTRKEVAVRLGISLETVKTHLRRVYEKLHVTSAAAAVAKTLGQRG